VGEVVSCGLLAIDGGEDCSALVPISLLALLLLVRLLLIQLLWLASILTLLYIYGRGVST